MEKRKNKRNPCSCFVPGCKSGYRSTLKRNKILGLKNPTLFSAKNPEERENWSKAIQRTDKEMKIGDKVCELHFNEDDIIKYYETLLADGTVWRMKKLRYDLKKGAVPTIFPNILEAPQKRKSQNVLNNTYKKSKYTYEKRYKMKSNKNTNSKKIVSDQSSTHPVTAVETDGPGYVEAVINGNSQQTEVVLNNLSEPFSYSALANNLESLLKPNSLWGISIHDGFVVCAKWNKEGILMKRVVIDSDLKIKVFFKNKAIEMGYIKINNMTSLSTLLKDIDICGVCENVNDMKKMNCDGYVLPHSENNLCDYCHLIGNWEIKSSKLDNLFWMTKGQHFMKLQTLYDKICTLNKNNMLLRDQLQKVFQIKAVWKLSDQKNQSSSER